MILDPLNLSIVAGLIILLLSNLALANSLFSLKNNIKQSWQTIINAFDTRTDLIPLLITTFTEYKKFDKKSLSSLIKSKNDSYIIKEVNKKFAIESKIDDFIDKIIEEGKRSKKLSADVDFLELIGLFEESKNEIRSLINSHNELTENYNHNLKSFYAILIRPIIGWRGVKTLPIK